MTTSKMAPIETTEIPVLVTIKVVVEPDPFNNGSPKIVAPSMRTETSARRGDILCWEIENRCPFDLWIGFQGFYLQSEIGSSVTLTIPNLFDKFSSYGDQLPAAVNDKPSVTTCLADMVSDAAPINTAWSYTITLVDKKGVADELDPIVVLSGDNNESTY